MNKYINIIKNLFLKEIPKPMGRWRTENNKQTNYKIDLSNEDHCGPCGQYALSKIEFNKREKKIKPENNDSETKN
jgi:hypothetical protein